MDVFCHLSSFIKVSEQIKVCGCFLSVMLYQGHQTSQGFWIFSVISLRLFYCLLFCRGLLGLSYCLLVSMSWIAVKLNYHWRVLVMLALRGPSVSLLLTEWKLLSEQECTHVTQKWTSPGAKCFNFEHNNHSGWRWCTWTKVVNKVTGRASPLLLLPPQHSSLPPPRHTIPVMSLYINVAYSCCWLTFHS